MRPTAEIGNGVAVQILAGKVIGDELPGLVRQERVDDSDLSRDGEDRSLDDTGSRRLA